MIYLVLDILFYTPNGVENKKGYIFIVFLTILYTQIGYIYFLFKKYIHNEIYITTIKAQSSEERPLTLNFENYSIKYFCKFGLPMGGILYKIL